MARIVLLVMLTNPVHKISGVVNIMNNNNNNKDIILIILLNSWCTLYTT